MKAKNNNFMTLEEFKEKNYGKIGTKERDELEAGYENFKIGALIHDARIEKVMQRLVRARIMNSVRGPGGGFVMSAKPEDIRLINIYEAVDGVFRCRECLFDHQSCDGHKCVLGKFIENINQQVKMFFETKTLKDLIMKVSANEKKHCKNR